MTDESATPIDPPSDDLQGLQGPEVTADENDRPSSSRFSGMHFRTYEMELLLSGAVVFGLLHLPPVVERVFTSFKAGLEGDLRWIGVFGQVYIQLMLFALIGAFILHLVMRGFWIGLLGLESVFPGGIRWNKVRLGPETTKRSREVVGSLAQAVEKADDLCSLIFSFCFMIVFIFIYSIVILSASLAIGVALSVVFFGGEGADVAVWSIAGFLLGFQALTEFVDKRFSRRAKPGGAAQRLIATMVRVGFTYSPLRFVGATQLTLGSNLTNSKVSGVVLFAVFALALVQGGGTLVDRGVIRFDSLTYFPDTLRETGIDPRHYRNLREAGAVEPLVPSIQSDLVAGPYLKLFLPYYPRRDNRLIAEACPDLATISRAGLDGGRAEAIDDARLQEAAACLGSLFQIALDGDTPPELHFDFTREPGTGLEGVVCLLSVRGLSPGRHELEVLVPSHRWRRGRNADPPEPLRHVIPFWR